MAGDDLEISRDLLVMSSVFSGPRTTSCFLPLVPTMGSTEVLATLPACTICVVVLQ